MNQNHPSRRAVILGHGAEDCPTQLKRLYEQLGVSAGQNLDALADILGDPNWVQGPAVICWLACPKNRDDWQAKLYEVIEEASQQRDDLTFVVR